MQAAQVKEDILLNSSNGDTMSLTYDLKVGDGLAARVESDGSIGVYGSSMAILNGNVSTSSDKDAQLLAKPGNMPPKTN